MDEILLDNILVVFVRRACQQKIGIPMSTNCAPLLAAYEVEFILSLLLVGKNY